MANDTGRVGVYLVNGEYVLGEMTRKTHTMAKNQETLTQGSYILTLANGLRKSNHPGKGNLYLFIQSEQGPYQMV